MGVPGTPARLASAVSNVSPVVSANATYKASYSALANLVEEFIEPQHA
jgi:hypothetical protein